MNVAIDRAAEETRPWWKAYAMALALFAVEVVLLYLFTLRFS